MLSDCTMRKGTLPKEPLLGSLSRECPLETHLGKEPLRVEQLLLLLLLRPDHRE